MVSVYLRSMSGERIIIRFKLTAKIFSRRRAEERMHEITFAPRQSWGNANFAMRSGILESLEDGALVIEVRMKIVDPTELPPPFIPKNQFACEAIQAMFMDVESADVVIEVGGQQFHAHRFVLRKCSTTLAELCESSGDQTTPIQISDVSPEIFRHLLKYVWGRSRGCHVSFSRQ